MMTRESPSKLAKPQRLPRPETVRPPPKTPQRPQRSGIPRSPRNTNKYLMDISPQPDIEINNSPLQSVSMEIGLPPAPQKDFRRPFQYNEKPTVTSQKSSSRDYLLKRSATYYVNHRSNPTLRTRDVVYFVNHYINPYRSNPTMTFPRTLTQRLELSREDENCNNAKSSFANRGAAGISTRTPTFLDKLNVDIRIMIYDAYFKGTEHEQGPPALVIAVRGDPYLYNEVIKRYYSGCHFTLSEHNIRWFQEKFPVEVVSIIRNLTVDIGVTLPTQSSIHHKYTNPYMKITRRHRLMWELDTLKIPLTRWTDQWLDAQKHQVENIYGEVWEDFHGLTEHLLSFSSLWKLQQAQNLRYLHLRTYTNETGRGWEKEHGLCQLIERVYGFFPRLDKMLLEDDEFKPFFQYNIFPGVIWALRAEFVTGDGASELKYIDHETQSRIISEWNKYPVATPVGFEIWRDPKTGLKRHFLLKIGENWSGNEDVVDYQVAVNP